MRGKLRRRSRGIAPARSKPDRARSDSNGGAAAVLCRTADAPPIQQGSAVAVVGRRRDEVVDVRLGLRGGLLLALTATITAVSVFIVSDNRVTSTIIRWKTLDRGDRTDQVRPVAENEDRSDGNAGRHARARAYMSSRSYPAGEPAGFVFEAYGRPSDGDDTPADGEMSDCISAATLLASAGPPIRVLDNPVALQEILRTHRERVTASSSSSLSPFTDASALFRAGIQGLVHQHEQQSQQAHGSTSGEGGDDGGDTVMALLAREKRRGYESGGSGRPREENGAIGHDAGGSNGRTESTAVANDRGEEPNHGEGGGDTGGGGDVRGFSDGGTMSMVLVLSGWKAEDLRTLLMAFPDTPWLYLHARGADVSCHQHGASAHTALVLHETSYSLAGKNGKGVILDSADFGPSAAARVLTRHFGVRLGGMGELRMAKAYAALLEVYATNAESGGSRGVGTPFATTAGFTESDEPHSAVKEANHVGCVPPETFPALEGLDLSSRLQEMSAESAKVLGGWFDTDWWCTPANHDEEYCSDKDKNRSSGGSRCSSNNSIGINSNSNDHKRPIRTSSKSQDGLKEGSGPGGLGRGSKNLVKSGHEVGAGRTPGIKESPVEHDPVNPWMRGMRRMVDGNAPLWMTSEVYSDPMFPVACPDTPDEGYPMEWPLLDVLENWNPGNASAGIPEKHFLGICRFDYETELHKAQAYCLAEVPFIVYNIPALDTAVQEWSDPLKLSAALRDKKLQIDVSQTNHFLYHGRPAARRPAGWTPPTRRTHGTFESWLTKALRPDNVEPLDHASFSASGSTSVRTNDREHYYLKLAHTKQKPFDLLARTLPFFLPDVRSSSSAKIAPRATKKTDGLQPNAGGTGTDPHTYTEDKHVNTTEKLLHGNEKIRVDDENREDTLGASLAFSYCDGGNGVDCRGGGAMAQMGDMAQRSTKSATSAGLQKRSTFSGKRGDEASAMRITEGTRGGESGDGRRGGEEMGREGRSGGGDGHGLGGQDAGSDGVNIFLRDWRASKGINCRIGMEGVMSTAHYDGSRNMVVLLSGKRRWILSNPRSCEHMRMYRRGHPSARHTSVDWTDPHVVSAFPRLASATANEVILRAGEALYVPEQWIHSVVNIGVSAQCNSRSGRSRTYAEIISNCEDRAFAV